MRAAGQRAGAVIMAVLAVAAGVGWLYLVRDVRALDVGPRLREALPLGHLAHRDAQPLLSLLVVWLGVGSALGVALVALRVRRVTVWAGVAVLVVLGLTGATSDAVQESQAVAPHLAIQLDRGAIWLAAAVTAVGATAAARLLAPRPPPGATA